MASLIKVEGKHREVLPLIFDGEDWVSSIPWVFADGMWRRTYDPGFVNTIPNSRLINGTDITVSQGKVIGVTPVGWTLGTMSTGSSYSVSNFTEENQVKNIRFVSEQSRHYYITRVQVEAGATYTASAMIEQLGVKNQRKVLQVQGDTASIDIDVDFDITKQMKLGRNSIQFYARTSGTVIFRMGACVDAQGDADVTISRPQITKSFIDMDWQPTPIVAPFYGINMLNSYLFPKEVLQYSDGEYSFDMTIKIEEHQSRPIMLFGRHETSGFSGVAFDNDNLYVYRSGLKDKESKLGKEIPIKRLIGLKVVWKKSGNYISDIRFYLNSELIARITSTLYSGNIDCIFGYQNNRTTNITIQSFSIILGKIYSYNVDEGTGNILKDRTGKELLTIAGQEFSDFVWVKDSSPPIVITDAVDQVADVGAYVRFFADATFYLSAQWYRNEEKITGANSPEFVISSITEADYGSYYCEFQNEYGKVRTSIVRLKSPTDRSLRIITEDNTVLMTENEHILLTEA